MDNTPNNVIEKIIERFPSFRAAFDHCEKNSTEIVLFGSYAYGCEHVESDIDILFVGNRKRKASKYFDFIWLKPERINSKTWLSSEIAIHIANYGIWLKGDGAWRNQVFFSQAASIRKKQRIFERLTHIYLQKEKLSLAKKKLFIQKIILNTLRLENLNNKIPNPPICVTLNDLQDPSSFFQEIFKPHLLGPVGKVFFEEIFPKYEIENVLYSILNDLKQIYKAI